MRFIVLLQDIFVVPQQIHREASMSLVTSRNYDLPDTPEALGSELWFNLWMRQLWPYRELAVHDTLYWYESHSRCIVWKSRVVGVQRFSYERKQDAEHKLGLTTKQAAQSYFVNGPESGYCLSYSVDAIERMGTPKRDGFTFPQSGWHREVNDVIAV